MTSDPASPHSEGDDSPARPSTRSLTRRALLAGGALAAASTLITATAPEAQDGRRIVVWGSSSAASYLGDEPRGFRTLHLHREVARLLGTTGINRAMSRADSTEVLIRRSEATGIDLDLGFRGFDGVLPTSGEIVLTARDGRVPITNQPIPGTLAGLPVTASGIWGSDRLVRLRRLEPGEPVDLHAESDGTWRTALEQHHRGDVHVLWMGKNNVLDLSQVLEDTRRAAAVEPERTIVMGHWKTWMNRPGTEKSEPIDQLNRAYAEEYGPRFFDTARHLLDPQMWRLPEIADKGIGQSDVDQERVALGLPPKSLIAHDHAHLNAYGLVILSQALAQQIRGLGMA